MNQVNTIEEVISQLDNIIDWSLTNKSRIGYFATLYRRITVAVQQAIINGGFEDGNRMEKLDVIFANRYFFAWDAYTNKQPSTSAWRSAFDACENSALIVLQHLILGINTHINLDLCIAAAECCPGNAIYGLQNDFDKINEVIATQSQLVQDTLSNIWSPMKLLNNICNDQEKDVLNFSVDTARDCSWANAIVMANINDQIRNQQIDQIDNMVVEIGKKILDPGFLTDAILIPIKMTENKDVNIVIGLLKN